MLKRIERCELLRFPKVADGRGNLVFIEGNRHVPFNIERVFYIANVPNGAKRGGHAHREQQQLIIAISGKVDVVLDDGHVQEKVCLDHSFCGLYINSRVWCELNNFSSDAICMILASTPYEESEYYRDYNAFLQAVRGDE